MIDVHSHLKWDHPGAHSLADIVFYHFVAYELMSAGMPREALELEDDGERLKAALPYLPLIRFSGTAYALKRVLQDLYGMKEETLTAKNLEGMMKKVSAKAADKDWPRQVLLKKARITKTFADIYHFTRRIESKEEAIAAAQPYKDIFVPVIENQAFVAGNAYWISWLLARRTKKPLKKAADLVAAAGAFLQPFEREMIKAFLGWATVDFLYDREDETLVNKALKKVNAEKPTTPEEDNAVRVMAFNALLGQLKEHKLPYQFFFGSERGIPRRRHRRGKRPKKRPRWHGPDSIAAYSGETLRRISYLVAENREIEFDMFIGSFLFSQETNIMVKMHPNLHVSGIWWHNMYPVYIRRMLEERLDVCPLNKVSLFFSDAYMAEWSYGKRRMVEREFAAMLSERVERGYITRKDASLIIKMWMYDNPAKMYGLQTT